MLRTFTGQNYKAYESFKLDLKPLTILLGANSCGKSALINSLLMFSQTVDSMSLSDSA
ncbi:AAA family ATPase, partial [Escherichia coli]|nr:AAA family ATPase [Escherichia coli]